MRYRAILIDADDTLFDFQIAERNAIDGVLRTLGILEPGAHETYSQINHACWLDFEKGLITQDALKIRRFAELLQRYRVQADPHQVAAWFTQALSNEGALIDGALEAVSKIAERLPVAIVTNGIGAVQRGRMAMSPLGSFVKALIISEEVGCAKPDPRMIQAALEALGGIDPFDALMVGDSLTSDMRCALNAGTDSCWYNPNGKPRPEGMTLTYEIRDISALPKIALA